MYNYYLIIILAPLISSILAGFAGHKIGRNYTHWLTILGVGFSFLFSLLVLKNFLFNEAINENITLYIWAITDSLQMEVGLLVDNLTALMMCVVTFVSLMVHVYTIGYMKDDPGYQRFFSYISLFTFSMLMLVMSNNFLQLFFGWEAVGLVSYLLIGFWFKKESAIFANLKAFLVNRVGDFGFLLGIAGIVMITGSLDYVTVFSQAEFIADQNIEVFEGVSWNMMTLICILLFIGAMGKSAQAPLHVWLPDSMEGPTPISALIHAATMVTAGIFMVARMSPLFELSITALSFIILIGSFTAFFMGILGIIQNDIKRVVAYSTLSQLGYMTVALGASAYSAAIFHLMTHAFFKALLFLAAGSVIIAMHHEQDIRKMGGIRKYMPITYWTSLIGTLALIGFPGSSGFFSKDLLIEAVKGSHWQGYGIVYWIAYSSVLLGVFITALYSFRMFFLVFHGEERMTKKLKSHLHESPISISLPLILLAIPSLTIGWFTVSPLLFGEFFNNIIFVNTDKDVLSYMSNNWQGSFALVLHSIETSIFWLAASGVFVAWYLYLKRPDIPNKIKNKLLGVYNLLEKKYYFDDLWIKGFAGGGITFGQALWKRFDQAIIDDIFVNGTSRIVVWLANTVRQIQTGYLFTYAFSMIIGLTILLGWLIWIR